MIPGICIHHYHVSRVQSYLLNIHIIISVSSFFIAYFGPAFRHGTLPSIRGVVSGTMFSHHLGEPSKNVYFMVRLTIMGGGSTLMVRVLWFFQNKLTYFDLFYYCIKGKSGPKFSHLLMVRLGAVTPPPLTVSLTVKYQLFFTPSLS